MSKLLSEMTLEELWELFPIILTKHKNCWNEWYQEEAIRITKLLPSECCINHVGSTAIKNIWAKPIIDILVEAPLDVDLLSIKSILVSNGYQCMSQSDLRVSFNKGYTQEGFVEKVFHLHLRYFGDNDELYFRDYLNEHQDTAQEYEEMKLLLWKKYEYNRDEYTEAKTEFITNITNAAKMQYGRRYR
ncbi:GrpB family protein [Lachnospiraceae bacterium LCP25S3_G4]